MSSSKHNMIHALEFECQTPLKFYERCSSCARFDTDCPDLSLGIEILRGKKKIVYDNDVQSEESLLAQAFNCLTPLYYFENTRKNCAHRGRCREEEKRNWFTPKRRPLNFLALHVEPKKKGCWKGKSKKQPLRKYKLRASPRVPLQGTNEQAQLE